MAFVANSVRRSSKPPKKSWRSEGIEGMGVDLISWDYLTSWKPLRIPDFFLYVFFQGGEILKVALEKCQCTETDNFATGN